MRKGVYLTIAVLFLVQGSFLGGSGAPPVGPRESAAIPLLNVKSIHPLPEWDDAEDLRPPRDDPEDSSGSHLKVSLPVGLLAMLLFFLMWKFLQSQE